MTSSAARPTACEPAGRIFDIQRYSLHDGRGIRTLVFFKGCPLCCPWCSNPESQSAEPVYVRRDARCIHCRVCRQDEEECPSGAYELLGRDMTVDEICAEALKDQIFYRASGGGVTLSGGEVLMQASFAIRLLERLKALGIRTAIETSGQGARDHLLSLGALCDEVLYDFKIMDAERARSVMNLHLDHVLEGFRALVASGVQVIPRLPLIPGYTASMDNLKRVLAFLRPFAIGELHLLPLHHYGAAKYGLLGLPYELHDIPILSAEEIATFRGVCEAAGYRTFIGG